MGLPRAQIFIIVNGTLTSYGAELYEQGVRVAVRAGQGIRGCVCCGLAAKANALLSAAGYHEVVQELSLTISCK